MAVVFAGTYTETRTEGIYQFLLDDATGALTPAGAIAAGPNPTYLALHPERPLVYAVNEAAESDGIAGGSVTALQRESGGAFAVRGRQTVRGSHACHLSLYPSLRHLLIANYTQGEGSIGVLPLTTDGEMGPLTDFVRLGEPGEKSHAHCILSDPSGQFVLASDLGQDAILVYRFDAEHGTLTPHEPPSISLPGPSEALPRGAGPRHLVFSLDGRFLYCINEYASSVTAFVWEHAAGVLREIQVISTLPPEFTEKNTGAALHLSPDGLHLYASNRGHDSLAVFRVDQQTGRLTLTAHVSSGGQHPRDFAFDSTGEFLVAANRTSNSLVVFRLDRASGGLTPTHQEAVVPHPVCVKFAPPAWETGGL